MICKIKPSSEGHYLKEKHLLKSIQNVMKIMATKTFFGEIYLADLSRQCEWKKKPVPEKRESHTVQ